ncbi:MAG: EAL domain-containing protein, partial [Erysipelotrichales bacterium]|nr:EAL domain-containing protein [Erysipelotrichales bacterium]
AYTDNPELMLETIKKLHAAGFKISMDDFGSGYSSLNTLKDIYIDELKMDMKFFSKGNEERGAKILEAVVNMARTLEIPVIAEGVETKESVEFLSKLGCYNIQGYYYAKPMPLKDFEEFVDKAM